MSDIWESIAQERAKAQDPALKIFTEKYIDNCASLSEVLLMLLVAKFSDEDLTKEDLSQLLPNELDNSLIEQDISTLLKRDFASKTYLEVLLLNRSFHALTAYRVSHQLWKNQEFFSAKWLNKRCSEIYGIDIHPGAEIGKGLVLDHCMGIVIGETCKIEDNVFLFHNVTLGGTGRLGGDRHPKIKSNVLIGAGATILGNITIGKNAVVAAGSVVLDDVPPNTMVAGVPACAKGEAKKVQ